MKASTAIMLGVPTEIKMPNSVLGNENRSGEFQTRGLEARPMVLLCPDFTGIGRKRADG